MRKEDNRQGRKFGSSRFSKNFRRDYGSNRFQSGPREMHKAVCSDCGCECEVPFKPTEGKPVYCKSCYVKYRPRRF